MQRIYFNKNQISEIPGGIFLKCTHLTTTNFALNRIKEFHFNYFSCSTKVRSLNLEKNNIQAVSFNALEPFSKSTDINFTNNCLQNSKSIYSSLLQQKSYSLLEYSDLSKIYFYKKLDSSQYFIIRQYEEALVEKYFLALYLSSSSKTCEYICSVKSNFNRYNSKEMADHFQTEFSLLHLFISVFGEIDDSKIINLAKHINQMLSRDENLQNIEFLIRSEESFRKLCERNI